jgi:DNA-binding CsgD family transcriptional regulator
VASGFDDDGVVAFVEAAAGVPIGAVPARAVSVLAEQTAGNPFLLGELWRHLVETGALVHDDAAWKLGPTIDDFDSPDSVRALVARRLDRLPEAARALVEVAAVIGPSFGAELLAETADTDVASVLELLEPALAGATVEQLGPGQFRFTHAIVQRALYDRLTTARRATLHLEVARVLERGAVDDRVLGDLARHYAAAVPVADAATAVETARRAADVSVRSFAYEDAVELLLRVLPLVSDPVERAATLLAIVEAELPAGDAGQARAHALEAVDIARDAGCGEFLVRGALSFEEASWRLGLHGAEAERLVREALSYITDDVTRIRALATRGRALALCGDESAAEVIETAIASARELGDRQLLLFTLSTFFNLTWDPERYGIMLERAYELRLLCAELGDPELQTHGQQWFVAALLVNAQFDALDDAIAEHTRASVRSHQPFHRHLNLALRSTVALMRGAFAEAERFADEAADYAAGLSGVDVSGAYGVQMFSLRREQGRLDEIRPVVEAVARLDRAHAAWRPGLAAVYAETGLVEEAREEIRLLVTPGLAHIPRDALYEGALTYLADAITILGDRYHAAAVYAALEPYRNSVVVVGHLIACYGSVDRYLGALAETAGRARDAERHYVRAIELDTAAGARTWLAHSRFRYARFLARQGRRDGPQRALRLLDDVVSAARTIGMPRLEGQARELADELEDVREQAAEVADVDQRRTHAGLTPREREILDCLVDGLSNAEIGRALHISANTAANHVRAILLKTGCANRTEVAAWAVRRGVVTR